MLNNRRSLLSYQDENLAEKHVILWDDYHRANFQNMPLMQIC